MGDKTKVSKDKSDIQWDIASLNASSATELTGLIPRGSDSEDEIEAYDQILTYRPGSIVGGRDKKIKRRKS